MDGPLTSKFWVHAGSMCGGWIFLRGKTRERERENFDVNFTVIAQGSWLLDRGLLLAAYDNPQDMPL